MVTAIFENGVFRPTQPVDLPDNARVEFEPRLLEPNVAEQIESLRQSAPGLAAIYETLSRRHQSGRPDTAERHNEHQP